MDESYTLRYFCALFQLAMREGVLFYAIIDAIKTVTTGFGGNKT